MKMIPLDCSFCILLFVFVFIGHGSSVMVNCKDLTSEASFNVTMKVKNLNTIYTWKPLKLLNDYNTINYYIEKWDNGRWFSTKCTPSIEKENNVCEYWMPFVCDQTRIRAAYSKDHVTCNKTNCICIHSQTFSSKCMEERSYFTAPNLTYSITEGNVAVITAELPDKNIGNYYGTVFSFYLVQQAPDFDMNINELHEINSNLIVFQSNKILEENFLYSTVEVNITFKEGIEYTLYCFYKVMYLEIQSELGIRTWKVPVDYFSVKIVIFAVIIIVIAAAGSVFFHVLFVKVKKWKKSIENIPEYIKMLPNQMKNIKSDSREESSDEKEHIDEYSPTLLKDEIKIIENDDGKRKLTADTITLADEMSLKNYSNYNGYVEAVNAHDEVEQIRKTSDGSRPIMDCCSKLSSSPLSKDSIEQSTEDIKSKSTLYGDQQCEIVYRTADFFEN